MTRQVKNINQRVVRGMDNFFMTYHKDAVKTRENPLKLTTAIPRPESGKEQRRMFATRLDKIIVNASNA